MRAKRIAAIVCSLQVLLMFGAFIPNPHAFAEECTLSTYGFPGSAETYSKDLNNSGQTVGFYSDSDVHYAFLRNANGSLVTLNLPGSVNAEALAINDNGQIAGWYDDDDISTSAGRHGFIGNASFDVPGSSETYPVAISNTGQIAGTYYDSSSAWSHGFLRNANGSIVTFDGTPNNLTVPYDINDAGQVIGWYRDDASIYHGFLRNPDGSFVTIDVPGSTATYARGINEAGQIAGYYLNFSGAHGFLRNPDGSFVTFNVPGSVETFGQDINEAGKIVGDYRDSSDHYGGFVRNPDGSFIKLDASSEADIRTYPQNINDTDQIEGYYYDASFATYSFLASGDCGIVNQPPTATGDTYEVQKGKKLDVSAPGVLSNDSDPESESLSATLESGTANGTLTFNGDGSFSYKPKTGFTGIDTFTYSVSDGELNSEDTTVTITVNATLGNRSPTATADTYEATQNKKLTVPTPGVLLNDSDPDGDSLKAVVDTEPTNGVLVLKANGSFTYTPTEGFTGNDTFTYHAKDASLNSGVTTVTITVTLPNECKTKAGKVIAGLTSLEDLEAQYPPPTPGLAVDFNNQVHANPANPPVDLDPSRVQAELLTAIEKFRQVILGVSTTTTFTVTSGYRPSAYQAHLYEINQKKNELKNADPANIVCTELKTQVDNEFALHGLGGGVNKPGTSPHEVGKAFDVVICEVIGTTTECINHSNKQKDTIGGIKINVLAATSSLYRACGKNDPVHYSLLKDPDTGKKVPCKL